MLITLTNGMYNKIMFYSIVYMMIQFVYYTIRVQTICMRYIKNKNLNKMNNYFVKSIFENIFNY
jgi:hypothetical protein